jgi:excisionase family DNA binding protein
VRLLLSVREAAQTLNVPTRTLHRWVREGLVVSVRRGPRGTLVDFESASDAVARRRGLDNH